MQKISYVNGQYINHLYAVVHIEDRGYQFSDGVYEVIALQNGVLIDGGPHLDRLERSLDSLEIARPMARKALEWVIKELFRRNHCRDGCLYLQVTRGVAKRAHDFPKEDVTSSLVMTVSGPKAPSKKQREEGVEAITYPDIRWGRRDIKTISLLPNVLAKEQAARAKVREAWLYEDGMVTEGSSSNSYIVTKEGVIVTHPANERILGGITRNTVLNLARQAGMKVEERPFTLAEIKTASEAFLTSTTTGVLAVVKIDDTVIGNGFPREVTSRLMQLYEEYARAFSMPPLSHPL